MKDDLCMRKGDLEKNMMSCCLDGAAEREREIFVYRVACEETSREKSCTNSACPADAERGPRFSGGRAER